MYCTVQMDRWGNTYVWHGHVEPVRHMFDWCLFGADVFTLVDCLSLEDHMDVLDGWTVWADLPSDILSE